MSDTKRETGMVTRFSAVQVYFHFLMAAAILLLFLTGTAITFGGQVGWIVARQRIAHHTPPRRGSHLYYPLAVRRRGRDAIHADDERTCSDISFRMEPTYRYLS